MSKWGVDVLLYFDEDKYNYILEEAKYKNITVSDIIQYSIDKLSDKEISTIAENIKIKREG